MGSGPAEDPQPPGRPARAVASSGPVRSDVAAPHWLAQLVKPRPAPIDWKRAARAAIALPTPIVVGLAFGHLSTGVLVSIGALVGTVTSISGPYRDRLRRSGFAVLAGAIGFFLGDLVGTLTGERSLYSALLIVLASAVSAVLSAAGNNASLASLQLLVYVILGTHESTVVGPLPAVIGFGIGAGWAILLSVAAWPVHATAPERGLVAAVYDQLAVLLRASGTPAARASRQQLTTALNQAYDALLTARSRLQGRDEVYRRLFVVLSSTTPVVEATVALINARHRPPRSVVDAVGAVGAAIREDRPVPELDLPDGGSPGVAALTDGLRTVAKLVNGEEDDRPNRDIARRPDRPSRRERLGNWFDEVIAGPAAWLHALRLSLCMAVAELLNTLVPVDRSYWVLLTIAIVLKPDFGSVFARAVLRGGGTFVGALLGAGVLALNPNGWLLVVLVAAIGFLLPIAQVRNYGMFSTVLTPLVIIQLDLGHAGSWSLVLARLLDTVVGCAIVLVFGYLLWPGSRTPKIGGRLADAVDAVARYADRALSADPRGRSAIRRRTYRQLSDLRTEFQRTLVEPSAAGRLASAWYPAIVGLERLTSAITRVAVEIERGEPSPPRADVERVAAALAEIAGAIRTERPPADPPMLESERLSVIEADLAAVVAALRGPDLDSLRPFALVRRLLPRSRNA